MKKRSVAAVVILSIITCGIYMLWYIYVTARDLQKESGMSEYHPVGILLFSLFGGNVGGFLFGLDANKTVMAIKVRRGIPVEDNKYLWTIFGAIFPIVTVGLVQNEINQVLSYTPPNNGFGPGFGQQQNGYYNPYGQEQNSYQQNPYQQNPYQQNPYQHTGNGNTDQL